jgi:hypothetical protein
MSEATFSIRRRFLRFSLRTLLLLVVVLSIPLAWLAYQLRIVMLRKQALASLERSGATVEPPFTRRSAFLHIPCDRIAHNGEVPRMREWLGDCGVQFIELPFRSTEQDRREIAAVFPEACVELFHPERH